MKYVMAAEWFLLDAAIDYLAMEPDTAFLGAARVRYQQRAVEQVTYEDIMADMGAFLRMSSS